MQQERPTWSETWFDIAHAFAKRSTCYKKKTAAIIVKNNRILSAGYNGVPSGAAHCEDIHMPPEDHREWSNRNELHAEMNAILHCSSKEDLRRAEIYTILSPCIHCAKSIYTVGIAKVIYQKEYRDTSGIDFLEKCGILVKVFGK